MTSTTGPLDGVLAFTAMLAAQSPDSEACDQAIHFGLPDAALRLLHSIALSAPSTNVLEVYPHGLISLMEVKISWTEVSCVTCLLLYSPAVIV